jgi:hypothetical protein
VRLVRGGGEVGDGLACRAHPYTGAKGATRYKRTKVH